MKLVPPGGAPFVSQIIQADLQDFLFLEALQDQRENRKRFGVRYSAIEAPT
jgi:hypothetical protein